MYPQLKALRKQAKLKQKDVAAYLNCSQQVYSNYELGQRDIPTEYLIKLAQLYRTTTDYILGLSNKRER
jgi:transcriptional regulator with XRE-family HTH domain